MLKATLITCTLLAASAASAQLELTSNCGFETGDTTGWEYFQTPNSTFVADSGNALSGSFAGRLENLTDGSAAVIKQANLGIGIVQPGDLVTITFSAKAVNQIGGVNFAEFFSEIDGGGTSSAQILGGAPLFAGADWTPYSFTATAGPNVSAGITLQFTATTGANIGSTSLIFIDNVSVTIDAEEPCPADTNNDGEVTPADFSAWIAAFNTQSPACDQNGDGLCTAADFSAWITNYNAGCN